MLNEAENSLRALTRPSPQLCPPSTARRSNRLAVPDVLGLARTLFRCRPCQNVFQSREVLSHPCLYGRVADWARTANNRPFSTGEIPHIEGDVYDDARLVHYHGRLPWSTAMLDDQGDAAEIIIRLCNRDPDHVTADDLDRSSERLICGPCSLETRRAFVMDWRAAAAHVASVHASQVQGILMQAPLQLSAHARDAEMSSDHKIRRAHEQLSRGWECLYCLYGRLETLTKDEVVEHVRQAHDKHAVDGCDIRRRGDARGLDCGPILLLASSLKTSQGFDAFERQWMERYPLRYSFCDLRRSFIP